MVFAESVKAEVSIESGAVVRSEQLPLTCALRVDLNPA
jgi:hypothetical protein